MTKFELKEGTHQKNVQEHKELKELILRPSLRLFGKSKWRGEIKGIECSSHILITVTLSRRYPLLAVGNKRRKTSNLSNLIASAYRKREERLTALRPQSPS